MSQQEQTFYDSGPWYEIQGPNAEYVRKHQFSRLTERYNIVGTNLFPFQQRILQNALDIFIPDSMNNFGSYRGYGTFGLDTDVEKQITNAYQDQMHLYEQSMQRLRQNFTPLVIHYLYKPGGLRYGVVAEENKDKFN